MTITKDTLYRQYMSAISSDRTGRPERKRATYNKNTYEQGKQQWRPRE